MGEVALRLETAANRFATTAKGLGAYVGFTAEISDASQTWAEAAKVIETPPAVSGTTAMLVHRRSLL